jgi:mono/diheme cytochrome c family protein
MHSWFYPARAQRAVAGPLSLEFLRSLDLQAHHAYLNSRRSTYHFTRLTFSKNRIKEMRSYGGACIKTLIIWLMAGLLLGSGLLWSPAPALAQSGQDIFNNHCAMCHGTDGRGNGPAAAALNPPPADFHTASFWQNTSRAQITETIEDGRGQMPSFNLSPSQIKAVIDYMSQTFRPGK